MAQATWLDACLNRVWPYDNLWLMLFSHGIDAIGLAPSHVGRAPLLGHAIRAILLGRTRQYFRRICRLGASSRPFVDYSRTLPSFGGYPTGIMQICCAAAGIPLQTSSESCGPSTLLASFVLLCRYLGWIRNLRVCMPSLSHAGVTARLLS